MSTNPRNQLRLQAITGSIADLSSQREGLNPTPASSVNASNLHDILKQTAESIRRIHGASSFTEAEAGVFSNSTSVFSGSVALKDISGNTTLSLTREGEISGSANLQVGGNITGVDALLKGNVSVVGNETVAGTLTITGSAKFNSTLETDGKATLASALVENLNVAGGMVFTDAQGNLDNDAAVVWDNSSLKVTGVVSGSGNFQVGGSLTVASGANISGETTMASVIVSDLTQGRLVLAGASGALEDSSNLTFVGGELDIVGTLDVSSMADIGGNFSVATDKFAVNATSGDTSVAGKLNVTGAISGSVAKFTGEVNAASVKVDNLTQPGVVIAGPGGTLTTTASLFYTQSRLEVSSSVRISGDMAVNGEDGIADITSTAVAASVFDTNVTSLYLGGAATYIDMGAANGIVNIAGDLQVSGSDIKDNGGNTRITMFDGVAVLATVDDSISSDGVTLTYAGDQGTISLPSSWQNVSISLVATEFERTFAIPSTLSDLSTGIQATVSWSATLYSGGQNVIVPAYATGTISLSGQGGGTFTNGSISVTSNAPTVNPTVEISADLRVKGNDIKDSRNDVIITFSGNGEKLTTLAGDLKVSGNSILASDGGTTIEMSGRNVIASGSLFVSGSSMSFVGATASAANIDLKTGGALSVRGGILNGVNPVVALNLSGTTLGFNDGYMIGNWDKPMLSLADSSNDWTAFKNAFGEVSLLSAINSAAGGFGDGIHLYKVTSSISSPAVVSSTNIIRPQGTNFGSSYLACDASTRDENIKFYLNGQLLVSKSFDAVNYDYDVHPVGSSVTFNFGLESDDTIIAIVPLAVASTDDYISTIGYDLCGTVDGKPASSEVVFKLVMPRSALFNDGYAYVDTASTNSVSLKIQKGIVSSGSVSYTEIGQINFAAGSATGAVVWNGGYANLNRSEIIRVVAPSIVDATFSSPVFTLIGLES